MSYNTFMKKEHKWILDEKYKGIETPEFEEDVKRVDAGEPVDYIIGSKPFLRCVIDLSHHPLIPREETEYWVEKVIHDIQSEWDGVSKIKCLDLFAGSGCIGVAILRHIPFSILDFGENNSEYIDQIQENIVLNNIDKTRTRVIESDVFENIHGTYDYILANPPYVSREKIKDVQKSVLDFEPHSALFAENEGLFYVKKIIDEAHNYLNPGGRVYIEFDSWQQPIIQSLIDDESYSSIYEDMTFINDQYERPRVVVITKTATE